MAGSIARPFRFGVMAVTTETPQQVMSVAQRAKDSGYATLFVSDHLNQKLAPISMMAAVAAATDGINVGTLVINNEMRNPVTLSMELATIDALSNGGLEVGIGAGYLQVDFEHTGIPKAPAMQRIERLAESVRIIKSALAGDEVPGPRKHYRTPPHVAPMPAVQRPRPKLIIGAGGPHMLRLAAREADIISINPQNKDRGGSDDGINVSMGDLMRRSVTRRKIEIIREAAGSRYDQLEILNVAYLTRVTDDYRNAAEMLGNMVGMSANDVGQAETVLVGTRDMVIEEIYRRREELDMSYVVVPHTELETFAPVVAELTGK